MTYTNVMLLILGMIGVFLHNLIKLNDLNRKANGMFSLRSYLRVERFSIAISFIVVFAAVIVKHEILELEIAGKYLGLGFVAMGYMGQSIIVALVGRANKIIGAQEEKPEIKVDEQQP